MLAVRDLRRRFGATQALDGLDLDVPPGEVVGFVGRNGAGKTTAMRVVCGLLSADGGTVSWDGRPADGELRRRVGYMPEERGLYPRMRAGEQVAYLAELHGLDRGTAGQRAAAWLEHLGLGGRASDRVEELSLGNQQRVQLAAALVHDPVLLVLDEPFSGLDPVAADLMADVLAERAAAGAAVLFSSHQLELVERLCDRVAIVERGRLVAGGPVARLREEAAARRPAQVRVEVDAAPGWADRVPGTRVLDERDGALLLELAGPGADGQAVLDAARAQGRVRAFAEVRPTLAELFREAVRA